MLSYPDRFRFKSVPPRTSRLMFVWFLFLLLMVVLSVGMLLTAIVQAAQGEMTHDIRLARHLLSVRPDSSRWPVAVRGNVTADTSFGDISDCFPVSRRAPFDRPNGEVHRRQCLALYRTQFQFQ